MTNTVEGSSSQAGSDTLQDPCQRRVVHAATNDSNYSDISSQHSALRKKAGNCQRSKVRMYKSALEKATMLEEMLHDVFLVLSPQPIDYDARRDLIRVFNEIALEIYGCSGDVPVAVELGSFSMDLFQAKSDLDLSINFSDLDIPHDKKIQTLCTFEKKLSSLQCSGHVYGVYSITTAKVPVLKVVDSGTGIECDISVGNMDGILKSKTLYFISLIDERFRKLCFLMKAWARAHNINSARDRTLNSLSIILLVAFHLQTRNPPILPPFSAILKDGYDVRALEKSISKFKNYGHKNTEGVAELFFTLLLKLSSIKKLWSQGLCASTYDGKWIYKTWGRKAARIRVEDFHDGDQNVSRAVGVREMNTIYKCINLSINHISEFLRGRMEGYTLREFLFGKDGAISVCKVPMNFNADGLITLWPPPRIEDKDTDFQKLTKPGEHRNLSIQPSSKNLNAGEVKTEMWLSATRIEDKGTSDLKSTQQPGEGRDQSAQPSSKNFNAIVPKDGVPLSTTRIQDIEEEKDTSGLQSTQQGEGWDQSAQPSSENFNADMAKTEMPLNATRIDDKDSSGLKSTQQPGEGRDQSTQPSKANFNTNVAKYEVPLGTTRIQDIEEDKDTSELKLTQQGEGWDQSAQPSSKTLIAGVAKTGMPLNATRMDDKDSSGLNLTLQPDEGWDQSAQPSSKNFNANVAKDGVPLSTTRIQDFEEEKDSSGLKSTQQGEGWDQSAQPSSKTLIASVAKTEMPLNATRMDDKDSSGLKSTQQPGVGRDQSTQPSKVNFNTNVAKYEVPLGTTRIHDIEEDKDTIGLKLTQQGESWDQSTQPSSNNLNADMAKTKMPLNATRIDDKDSSGRKLTQQPNEGRDQSAQPNRNQTTLGKRKRTDRPSLPSTFFRKPLGYGKMKSQSSMPYDLSSREHIEHRVLSWDGLGQSAHILNRAGHTLPTYPNDTRYTSANGESCYHETGRIPNLPTPVAHPIYASGTGNWTSSVHTREADIATTFATQMVYPNYHYNQLHFQAPHFSTPSIYATSTPIVPQMVPNRVHGTFGAGNFPSASMMPGYPPAGSSRLYRTNSSHPQVNSSAHELAWFRRAL